MKKLHASLALVSIYRLSAAYTNLTIFMLKVQGFVSSVSTFSILMKYLRPTYVSNRKYFVSGLIYLYVALTTYK